MMVEGKDTVWFYLGQITEVFNLFLHSPIYIKLNSSLLKLKIKNYGKREYLTCYMEHVCGT